MDIKKITIKNNSYPKRLKNIYNKPKQLYVAGSIPQGFTLAIVGMRKNSPYGERVLKHILSHLKGVDLITVSGLAYGIDTFTHKFSLENNIKTIAVLGSGLNHIYPKSNTNLAQKIITNGGALISEYEPDTPPQAFQFPARNRIIAGLSDVLIVIEAAKKSGSLITAQIALEEGKDVWAVPGDIFHQGSEGTNALIAMGAYPLISVDYFMENYCLTGAQQNEDNNLSLGSSKILKLIRENPNLNIDAYFKMDKFDMSELIQILTELEIEGKITNNNGKINIL